MKESLFILWMLISLIFCFSIIGLVMFWPKDTWLDHESTPSTWMTIGLDLKNSIIKD